MNFVKYNTLVVVFIMTALSTFGRGIYVQPWVGGGITGTTDDLGLNSHVLSATTAGIKLGVLFSRLQLNVGAGILNTGLGINDLISMPDYPQPGQGVETVDFDLRYNELFMLVTVGVRILKKGRVNIMPEVGVAATYTLRYSRKSENKTTGETGKYTTTSNINERYSIIALGGVNITYNILPKIDIMLTPSYYRMLNDVTKLSTTFTRYAIALNAGVAIRL